MNKDMEGLAEASEQPGVKSIEMNDFRSMCFTIHYPTTYSSLHQRVPQRSQTILLLSLVGSEDAPKAKDESTPERKWVDALSFWSGLAFWLDGRGSDWKQQQSTVLAAFLACSGSRRGSDE